MTPDENRDALRDSLTGLGLLTSEWQKAVDDWDGATKPAVQIQWPTYAFTNAQAHAKDAEGRAAFAQGHRWIYVGIHYMKIRRGDLEKLVDDLRARGVDVDVPPGGIP